MTVIATDEESDSSRSVNFICRSRWASLVWTFDVSGRLVVYSACVQYLRKKWQDCETVSQIFLDFKKVYDSVRREVLYNILVEYGIPMKVVRLIRICLNETPSRFLVGKHVVCSAIWFEKKR